LLSTLVVLSCTLSRLLPALLGSVAALLGLLATLAGLLALLSRRRLLRLARRRSMGRRLSAARWRLLALLLG